MVLDNLKSAFDNIVDRFKSPFAGTFIIVWGLHHWILIFSLFNFDASCTLPDKLAIISSYLTTHTYSDLIWLPLAYTFVAIIAFFILHFIALAISTFFTSIVRPLIIRAIDKGSYIEKTDYLLLKEQKEQGDHSLNSLSQNFSLLTKAHNEVLDKQGQIEENIANANIQIASLEQELIKARPIITQDLNYRSLKLHSIFPNEWLVHYTDIITNEESTTKRMTVTVDEAIYIDGTMESDAKNIYFDSIKGYMTFDKIKRGEQSKASTVLIKINDTTFEGIENGAQRFRVAYKKLIPPIDI